MAKVPFAAKWIDARRNNGKVLLTPDNFEMNKSASNSKNIYLHCKERKHGCKVTASVDKDSNIVTSINYTMTNQTKWKYDVTNKAPRCACILT